MGSYSLSYKICFLNIYEPVQHGYLNIHNLFCYLLNETANALMNFLFSVIICCELEKIKCHICCTLEQLHWNSGTDQTAIVLLISTSHSDMRNSHISINITFLECQT